MTENEAFFRDEDSDQDGQARALTLLEQGGWVPPEAASPRAATALLMRFLREQTEADMGVLVQRARWFVERDRPFLPEPTPLWDEPSRVVLHEPKRELLWVDPRRVFPSPVREFQDRGDWSRVDEPTEFRKEPIQGLAEFARRIATERGDLNGLVELLGPCGEAAHVDLDGWDTPLGAFFRINDNGNHRATAFAVLGAPCIPATVRWNPGPFSVPPTDARDHEALIAYRTLLHCYGVASYPDPTETYLSEDRIVSDWPFLIDSADSAVRSLAVLERTVGSRHIDPVGRIPRGLFDDAAMLLDAGRRTRKTLERTRRWNEIGGIRGALGIAGLAR